MIAMRKKKELLKVRVERPPSRSETRNLLCFGT
jgi:hypothetical protein